MENTFSETRWQLSVLPLRHLSPVRFGVVAFKLELRWSKRCLPVSEAESAPSLVSCRVQTHQLIQSLNLDRLKSALASLSLAKPTDRRWKSDRIYLICFYCCHFNSSQMKPVLKCVKATFI